MACGCYWLLLTLSDDLKTQSIFPDLSTRVFVLGDYGDGYGPVAGEASSGFWVGQNDPVCVCLCVWQSGWCGRLDLRSWLITVYLHTAIIVSIYGVRQKFFGAEALATWVDPNSTTADEVRVYSYLGNPNLLAAYILPAILFSICAVVAWQSVGARSCLAGTMLLVHCACMYWTGCRGAWIGLVLAIFVMAMMVLYWILPAYLSCGRFGYFPLTIGTIVGAVALGILFVAPLRNRALSMLSRS